MGMFVPLRVQAPIGHERTNATIAEGELLADPSDDEDEERQSDE